MQEEFKRGLDVCNDILLTPCAVTPWGRLFEQLRFFEVLRAFYVMVRVPLRVQACLACLCGPVCP